MFATNDHQQRAIQAKGHCIVLACPGSGKTTVLTERAVRLLSESSIGRLCAVTFTRDAASELKSRILNRIPEARNRLAVGTFHSIALSQLKKSDMASRELMKDHERNVLLKRCYAQLGCATPFEEVAKEIDRIKSKSGEPSFSSLEVEDLYHLYQDTLMAEGRMDYADILIMTVKGMKNGNVGHLAVNWLLVDEAQDMDDIQCEWVMSHGIRGLPPVEITMVADDDQSLYGFRHALGYDGIRRVQNYFSAQEITLPVNYRCGRSILNHAARLITLNPNRAAKDIRSARMDNGTVEYHRLTYRSIEATEIVKTIKKSASYKWGVLARTNVLLEMVEAEFQLHQIPYVLTGSKGVWSGFIGGMYLGFLRSVFDDSWTGMANILSLCGIEAHYLNRVWL